MSGAIDASNSAMLQYSCWVGGTDPGEDEMTAKNWALDIASNLTLIIYSPTGQSLATRTYKDGASRKAILDRYNVGRTYAN